jgi:hypothetical protein
MAFDGNNSLKLVDTAYRHGTTRSDDRMLKDPRWIEDEEVDNYKDEVKNSTKVCLISQEFLPSQSERSSETRKED